MKNTITSNNLFLLLLAICALVMVFSLMLMWDKARQPLSTPVKDTQTLDFSRQGTSDETTEIEKDLKNTDFSELDQELSDIDQELSTY